MRLTQLFGWRKSNRRRNQSDSRTRSIEDTLASGTRRFRSVDPGTESQWKKLAIKLDRLEGSNIERSRLSFVDFRRPAIALVFAMLAVLVIGVVWFSRTTLRTYETMKGQQASIVLDDSTEVVLNYASVLTVTRELLGSERKVSLKGEAFFHVRHNGTPFIVSTETGTVRVLGTEFDVRTRDGKLQVGVLRGSVKVTCKDNGVDSSVILSSEQIVACSNAGYLQKPGKLPFSDYPGWMHGKLVFYRTDLASACKELASQLGIVISIQRSEIANTSITGSIDTRNVETALTALTQLTGTSYRNEKGVYTIN